MLRRKIVLEQKDTKFKLLIGLTDIRKEGNVTEMCVDIGNANHYAGTSLSDAGTSSPITNITEMVYHTSSSKINKPW